MSYYPLNWSQINVSQGTYVPSTQHSYNTIVFAYWERTLFQRALYAIKSNVPWEGTTKDFFNWCLYRRGFVSIYMDEERGLVFQPCSLSGYGFYYQPTRCIVSNPAYNGSREMTIDEDCAILKLTPDYIGIWDIINFYAEKLALLDSPINMSIVNNSFAWLLGAKNKGMAQALKKILDKIRSGQSAVVYDQRLFNDENTKSEPWQFLERTNLKQSYLTTDQLNDLTTLLRAFDREIGIPTMPYNKKERMNNAEVQSTEVESMSRCTIWVETLNESAKVVNEMFGTDLHFELRYKPDQGGGEDVTS